MTTSEIIILLINAALFDKTVSVDLSSADFLQIYNLAKRHSVANIVALGIQKAGITLPPDIQKKFFLASSIAQMQYQQQKFEFEKIKNTLNKNKIKFIALKGSRMRRFYKNEELRTSCDIDILYNSSKDIKKIFLKNGYQFEGENNNTLSFLKPPVIKVEMHKKLFNDDFAYNSYFNSIWDRALCQNEGFEYILLEEDFYAYMVAHMAKHFMRYGSGIRLLLDLYLYNKNAPQNFNKQKAQEILKNIGLLEFEQKLLLLTKKWFSEKPLTKEDLIITGYIVNSGIYGNEKNRYAIKLSKEKNIKKGKFKSFLEIAFPSFSIMAEQYLFLKKLPFLLPFAWFLRFFRVFNTKKRKKFINNKKIHNTVNKNYVNYVDDILEKLSLK